jgi:hypothetical protein
MDCRSISGISSNYEHLTIARDAHRWLLSALGCSYIESGGSMVRDVLSRMLVDAALLPLATVDAVVVGAGCDERPGDVPLPQRLRALEAVTVHRSPGGVAVAIVPSTVSGGDPLWMPVIEARRGWARVLLPCRPAGTAAWVRLDERVVVAVHHVRVEIDIARRSVSLVAGGGRRSWPVVAASSLSFPPMRTFMLGLRESDADLDGHAFVLAARVPGSVACGWAGTDGWQRGRGFGARGGQAVLVSREAMAMLEATVAAGTPVLVR